MSVVLAVALSGGDSTNSGGTKSAFLAGPKSPGTFHLKGTMTLTEGADVTSSGGCAGSGGYGDMANGATVTVYDSSGTIVGTGHLAHSQLTGGVGCEFDFDIPVPDNSNFYQIEVSHRGKVTYSATDAKSGNVSLTLG